MRGRARAEPSSIGTYLGMEATPQLFNELLRSVEEAAAIERGQIKPSRKFEVKPANDVARVRHKLGLGRS
jgi:hypothetical protein